MKANAAHEAPVKRAPFEATEYAKKLLAHWIKRIKHPGLRALCNDVTTNEVFKKQVGSATAAHHHAYIGGLLLHTAEVVDYAGGMVELFPAADTEAALCAAVLHDWCTIREYEIIDGKIHKTDYRRLIRHVAGSYAMVERELDKLVVPEETRLKILHAILAHHGKREWGSPVEPENVEAYILHIADMFSANYGPSRECPQRGQYEKSFFLPRR